MTDRDRKLIAAMARDAKLVRANDERQDKAQADE